MTRPRLLATTILALCSPFAQAAEGLPSLQELYRIIQAQQHQIEAQGAQIEALRQRLQERKTQVEQRLDKAERRVAKVRKATRERRREETSTKLDGGLKARSADGNFSFAIGGRLHLDAAWHDQDRTPLGDGTELRRARVYVAGKVHEDWSFRAEYDFSDDDIAVKDAYLRYSGFRPINIRVGHFQEPFSLEEMTSSNYITFMERALPNALVPSYHLGVGVDSHGKNWSGAAGLFGEPVTDRGANNNDDEDDGYGLAGRVTFAPLLAKARLVHLGASAEYREPSQDNQVRFRTPPESHVAEAQDLVDTGTINDVDDTLRYGLEAAAAWGPWSVQGEYLHARVDRNRASDLEFGGWYVYGSWLITGESRPYSVRRGTFRGVTPRHRYGAWELAARFSSLDLEDDDISGGREQNITVGLNWYPNEHFRLMANYVHADADPNDNGVDDEPDLFQIRAQAHF